MKEPRRIDKVIKSSFITAIALSVAFVLGIPAIIFGAIGGKWALLILGIIAGVVGFYGTPFAWISYGEKKRASRVVDCVTREHILSVREIATQLQWSEKEVKSIVQKSIVNNYIAGYIFDGEKLTLNEKRPQRKERVQNKCSACGATLLRTETGFCCPYCGASFEEK